MNPDHIQYREQFIPQGAVRVDVPEANLVYWTFERAGSPCALGYLGNAYKRPSFHFRYSSVEQREKSLTRIVGEQTASLQRVTAYKAEQKAQKALPHTLKVGDILYTSWGYDQTNVDFYQVVNLAGTKMVEVREIAKQTTNDSGTGPMSGYVVAVKDQFKSEPKRYRANSTNALRIEKYAYAHLWDGKPQRVSWYA